MWILLSHFKDNVDATCSPFSPLQKSQLEMFSGSHSALFVFVLICEFMLVMQGERDGIWAWQRINQLFNWLPLAALIERKIICMHGGIGRSINHVHQIEALQRPITMEAGSVVLMDLLWYVLSTSYSLKVRLNSGKSKLTLNFKNHLLLCCTCWWRTGLEIVIMWLKWVCWDCLQVWSNWKWQCGGPSTKCTRAWSGYIWGKWQTYIYARPLQVSKSVWTLILESRDIHLSWCCLLQPDRVMEFCKNNDLQLIVRAHECVMDGFERFAQGHLITLFSATNYCGKYPVFKLQCLS